MIADHASEPSHLITLVSDVIAHIGGGSNTDLDVVGISSCGRGGVLDVLGRPLDEVRISKAGE